MKSFWLLIVLIFCSFPCYLAYPNGDYDYSEDNSYQVVAVDPEIYRMQQDLDELYSLAKEKINSHENANEKTVDILRRLIDSNATGLLHNYPEHCPIFSHLNGIYTVNVTGLLPFEVYCEAQIAGPGWTVIQRRTNGNLNFYRNWTQYSVGFGDMSNEFFIGLDKLHAITASRTHELYIQLEDFSGNKRFARYDEFLISSESDHYRLEKLGEYSGDAGDSLKNHLGQKFSTFDSDNDGMGGVCSEKLLGAWWYGGSDCAYSSLNGLYLNGAISDGLSEKGLYWHTWKGQKYSYKSVQMMVRPRCAYSYPK